MSELSEWHVSVTFNGTIIASTDLAAIQAAKRDLGIVDEEQRPHIRLTHADVHRVADVAGHNGQTIA